MTVPTARAELVCDSGSLATTCTIATTHVVDGPITGAALYIGSGGHLKCEGNGCAVDITVTGTLTVEGTITGGDITVTAGNVFMGASGRITADYLGYEAADGPGAPANATVLSCDAYFSGGAGGHGGGGGQSTKKAAGSGCSITGSSNAPGGEGGYGDVQEPTAPGSGGQHAWHYGTDGDDRIYARGGSGGGVM